MRHRRAGTTGWTEIRNAWRIADGGALSYVISGLTNGESYEVGVQADGLAGSSPWSESTTGAPSTPPPAAPDGFSAARGNTNTSLFLRWNHKTGATSYHIQYARNSTFSIGVGTADVSVPAEPPRQMTHYLDGLDTSSQYFIRIASENAGGRSDWSDVVQERPRQVAVVEPVAAGVTEGDAAQFRFSLSPSNLERTITYDITVSEDFGVRAATGQTLTLTGSETLVLATTDDVSIEPDGSITVTITDVSGNDYLLGTPSSATVAVQDAGAPGSPVAVPDGFSVAYGNTHTNLFPAVEPQDRGDQLPHSIRHRKRLSQRAWERRTSPSRRSLPHG